MTDFNAVIAALSVDAARNILNYTPQLYRRYGSTEPVLVDPLATGVLFKMNNVRFLISAAHVIEENKELGEPNKIGIMIKNVFYNLNGFIKYSASGQHANNERIDLLIWRIDDAEVIADLDARYQFLTPSDLDINYQPFQGANYLIVGFPVSKTKKKIDKKIKAESFIFLTKEASKDLYQKLGFEDHSHIIVEYKRSKIKNASGHIVTGPEPYGISGCGLWYVPKLKRDENGNVPALLVGILHEWSQRHNVVIATRVHILTETIRQGFGIDLPKSTITKVNLS